eukprot:CAMPEP_0202945938 /NCGR_PEP_ID=MMETSP1395-20130829/7756_1 /ASSEMBLY_ACC=CAM_ASM_000871 /TAXON_ID=5961 /ORGANISM="Blepharisma japonicum, Strain Stock R1072" /LENGTH=122 /DNA_ID=CAMNT_0049646255 /DNA_START=686 /DNA_END=1054 /DNA_ORIENTATION=+
MDFGLLLNEITYDFLYDKFPYWKYCEELKATDEIVERYVRAYGEGAEMWVEVKQSLIASNYIWAMWSLASYKGPSEGYDFLEYALTRYRRFKNEYQQFLENGGLEGLIRRSREIFAVENSST